MSYDYYIFSNQLQPVTRDQLVTALGKVGFESEVYEEIHTPKLIEGNIAGYCTVLGWSKKALGRTALDEALRPGNRTARDKLFTDEALAYCNIYVSPTHEFLANFDSGYFERPDGQVSPEAIAAAKSAKTVYEISTSSGRSAFSLSLQSSVCKVIAELSTGIIEDPQAGEFFWPTEADAYFGMAE